MDEPGFLELEPVFGGEVVKFVFHMSIAFALAECRMLLEAHRRSAKIMAMECSLAEHNPHHTLLDQKT